MTVIFIFILASVGCIFSFSSWQLLLIKNEYISGRAWWEVSYFHPYSLVSPAAVHPEFEEWLWAKVEFLEGQSPGWAKYLPICCLLCKYISGVDLLHTACVDWELEK